MIKDATDSFPEDELYGVTTQLRRAALSVTANITEGFGRYTYTDKMHKYVQARGEWTEVMRFLIYCQRVGYISESPLKEIFVDLQNGSTFIECFDQKDGFHVWK